jgi:hypothetical protein
MALKVPEVAIIEMLSGWPIEQFKMNGIVLIGDITVFPARVGSGSLFARVVSQALWV